jgi:(1->4)-alpha-D-glucan 1-alpha-D-glucosylmutase
MDELLDRQAYRLAYWRTGAAELDYRRFFDVDALAATRMEGSVTFDLLHRLPAELLDLDVVDGLRVDHVDGLADPARYLASLRDLAGPSAWILVEKILRRDEDLPPWPVDGTTGYEVTDLLGGWLTDPEGAGTLVAGWQARTGESRSYQDVALEARREVLAAGFATDLDRVVDSLLAVCRSRRRHRDHTRAAVAAAVTELAVHTSQYRTYVAVGPDADVLSSEADRRVVEAAAAAAAPSAPGVDPELFDLLVAVLTGRMTGPDELQLVTRFQQLTGPVAAKGEEDTALYRWLPLPHRCEVGCDPGRPPTTAEEWHSACAAAQAAWPQRLTTLSTHDTKRSADARARLAALTATPDALLAAFDGWGRAVGLDGVDPGSAWLAFHALVAAWPIDGERAWTVVQKSVREAGLRTSWVQADEVFEEALHSALERALVDDGARAVIDELVAGRADAADGAALAQLLAQLLAPGVPDLYQGAEGWDRSLVDPDNRRPPDPATTRGLLADAAGVDPATAWADPEHRRTGLARTIVVRTALLARARHAEAVGPGPEGSYQPLAVTGPDAARVLGFTRGSEPRLAVVVARPGPASGIDATVTLPAGPWNDCFTGATVDGTCEVAKLHAAFPVALLER